MSISREVLRGVIHAVFDSLQELTKEEKSRAARQVLSPLMSCRPFPPPPALPLSPPLFLPVCAQSLQLGQVLAMWLGETTDCVRNKRRASIASISRTGHCSQIEMLSEWLEIGLLREFGESCSPTGRSSAAENHSMSPIARSKYAYGD